MSKRNQPQTAQSDAAGETPAFEFGKAGSAAEHSLFARIVTILERARGNVVRAVNTNMVLGFLGLPDPPELHESRLEQAICDNLQNFLFASKYLPNLPSEEQLRREIARERRLIEEAMLERRELTGSAEE